MSVLIAIAVAGIFAYLLLQLIGRSTHPERRFASSQGDPGVGLWSGGDAGGCAPGDGGCGDGGGGGGGGGGD